MSPAAGSWSRRTELAATAAYNHISLKADPEAFTWEVTGDIGTVDEHGLFTAAAPGTGTITVSAGRARVSIPVTVSSSGTVSAGGVMEVESFETKHEQSIICSCFVFD